MTNQNANPMESSLEAKVPLEERFGVGNKQDKEIIEQKVSTEKAEKKGSVEKDSSYQNILSKVQTQNDDGEEDTLMQDASTLAQQQDRESQITHLLDLAFNKGVGHAVKVAKKAEDYYVLDQLHDRLLADELHSKLEQAGLLE